MKNPLTAEAALLQALRAGPGYGLELIERVEMMTKGEVKLHQGNAYPTLRAMEREGLVTSKAGEPLPERGGRPRIHYHLTSKGKRVAVQQTTALKKLIDFGLVIREA